MALTGLGQIFPRGLPHLTSELGIDVSDHSVIPDFPFGLYYPC